VQLAKAPSLFWDRERGYALAKLKVESNVPQIQACAPCHSRRQIVADGFTGGCNYYDYYANELLTTAAYHADGQIMDEVYEYSSFLQSKMYHKNIKCSDCHDPHSARLKHTGNQVCTSCHQHPAGKFDGELHHRHSMTGTGSACVECHMPQTTYMEVDPRRDHSFRIPRPDLSVKLGTPNACTRCHIRDKKLPGETSVPAVPSVPFENAARLQALLGRTDLKEYADWLKKAREGDRMVQARLSDVDRWADAALDKWYGASRKREPHFAEALHAAREIDRNAPAKLLELLADRKQPAIARATAALELGSFAEAGSREHQALRLAAGDPDPQVRIAAIRSLPRDGSDATVSLLAPLLSPPQPRAVRTEAARAILQMNQAQLTGEERRAFHAALDEYISGAMTISDRAGAHLNIATTYEGLGDFKSAETAYQTAIQVEPRSVGPRANLASLYERRIEEARQQAMQLGQSGDRAGAERAIAAIEHLPGVVDQLRSAELALQERDVLLAPYDAGVQYRTGLMRHTLGWSKEAESALLNAALLEPRNLVFQYHLAVLYRDTERVDQAQAVVRRMLKLQPENKAIHDFAASLAQPVGPALPQGP
jgi:Flp pilus assembly protein TadD